MLPNSVDIRNTNLSFKAHMYEQLNNEIDSARKEILERSTIINHLQSIDNCLSVEAADRIQEIVESEAREFIEIWDRLQKTKEEQKQVKELIEEELHD